MASRTVVIKVGTAILSDEYGQLKDAIIKALADELAALKAKGYQVVLVSSGAVGAGQPLLPKLQTRDEAKRRQVLSAVGQVGLINRYARHLEPHGLVPAQILVTKKDFESRSHYLNMRDCLEEAMRQPEVVPIVNENDTVAISELMFTDNDELASLAAAMLNAERLITLTSAPGLMSDDPADPNSKIISQVDPSVTPLDSFSFIGRSHGGRGGMETKCRFAYKLSGLGIATHIISGHQPENISKVINNEPIGTKFIAAKRKSSAKRWLAYANNQTRSHVVVDNGAKAALLKPDRATSLLLVGVVDISGDFEVGDTIYIHDENNQTIGWGRTSLSAVSARQMLANPTSQKPIVHYDNLHLVQM